MRAYLAFRPDIPLVNPEYDMAFHEAKLKAAAYMQGRHDQAFDAARERTVRAMGDPAHEPPSDA